MKLKLDEKILSLDYAQTLYQKLHQLIQQPNQSVVDYTEQFYQLLSRSNLRENDDQLVARYVSGLKSKVRGELIMISLSSLEEAYQMALKAEEKLKWDSYRKPESSKGEKDKEEKVVAQTSERPNLQGGGNKDRGKGVLNTIKCFRCGELGHRSYECPKKNAEVNLMEEEEQQPTYDEEPEGVFKEVQCEPDFDAESLVIQRVPDSPKEGAEKIFDDEECSKTAAMVAKIDWSKPPIYDEDPKDKDIALGELTSLLPVHDTEQSSACVSNKRKADESSWIEECVYEQRTKLFETYGIIRGFECLIIMDSGSQGNYVSQQMVSFLNLPTEYLARPYHVSWVNQGSRIPVTKRCLVEFSIGSQCWGKIWCNVLPMDSYDVLLGRPWQWDRNVIYRGRENVYELKMNGESIKLFPRVEKMKREKLIFIANEVIPSKKRKKCLYRRQEAATRGRVFLKKGSMTQELSLDDMAAMWQLCG